MTGTPSTTAGGAVVFPPGRYGRRRDPRRRGRLLPALLALVTAAAMVTVGIHLYRQYGDPAYDADVIRFTDVTDSQVVLEFAVNIPAGGSARCLVRARSRDGAEVGHAEVVVRAAPGANRTVTRYRLATSARPLTAEVPRCRPA